MRHEHEACHTPIAALRMKACVVVGHHLLEGEALDHELVDHELPQRRRAVHEKGDDAGQQLVL